MKRICFYLSDHGFGHIARNLPIVCRLLERADAHVFLVCGAAHLRFAEQNLTQVEQGRVTLRPLHTDVGWILREGTLLVDAPLLEAAATAFLRELPERARSEARWLRDNRMDAVVCDMPIWSIEAARQAGVPLLYIGNFTWAELYREYLPETIWRGYAAEYAKIGHALLYALHNTEMLEWVRGPEVSMVARPFHLEVARRIRKGHTRPVVFVSLGMSAAFQEPIDVSGAACDFYTTPGVPLAGGNVITVPYSVPNSQDYVLAANYVISKAGWGTVAEALLAGKPMALFARDSILEDRTTIRLLENENLAFSIEPDDLKQMDTMLARFSRLDAKQAKKYHDSSEEIAQYIWNLMQ